MTWSNLSELFVTFSNSVVYRVFLNVVVGRDGVAWASRTFWSWPNGWCNMTLLIFFNMLKLLLRRLHVRIHQNACWWFTLLFFAVWKRIVVFIFIFDCFFTQVSVHFDWARHTCDKVSAISTIHCVETKKAHTRPRIHRERIRRQGEVEERL